MNEFQLIKHFFTRPTPEVTLGVGDDAAIFRPASGCDVLVSSDMLVAGRHFFADVEAFALGHKALAVNLSDMAAMGAWPRWALLSLALPSNDQNWLQQFSNGFFSLAEKFNVALIGGDTTCGALNISVTIIGETPTGKALRRDGAQYADDIWISGEIGLAALAVQHKYQKISLPKEILNLCCQRLDYPTPRVNLSRDLLALAHACIDISDGVIADLKHILERSNCGATLYCDEIPTHKWLSKQRDTLQNCLLCGGDDYELLFCAPTSCRTKIEQLAALHKISLTRVGFIEKQLGLRLLDAKGAAISIQQQGYDHFATS